VIRKGSTLRDANLTLFASTSWKLLKKINTDGIGLALIVEIDASISIVFLQAIGSREREHKFRKKKLILKKKSIKRETDYLLRTNQVHTIFTLGPLVTYEVFLKWKEDRRIKKEAEIVKKKVEEEKKNKNKALLRTGRELFSIDPTLFIDDE
jgi:hypothetical protein